MFVSKSVVRCLSTIAFAGLVKLSAFSQGNGAPLILPAGEDSLWEPAMEEYLELHRSPTKAIEVSRMVMPWEPTRAVALAAPLGEISRDNAMRTLFLDTLAALLPKVEVVVYYHRLDNRLLGDFLGYLEDDPRLSPFLENLILEPSEAYSIWIRDFGPQFALGKSGELILLNPNSNDPQAFRENLFEVKKLRDPLQQHFRMVEELGDLAGLEGSDRIPASLASMLATRWGADVRLVRPPLFLQGGDFLPVDAESVLVSSETLKANGGRVGNLEKILSDYYGAKESLFLENLPGKTIEHLDFFVNPIRDKTIILGKAPQLPQSDRSYHRYLSDELQKRFARNRVALEKAFPDHRIVEMPMPPPVLASDDEVRKELFLNALELYFERERIAWRFDKAAALSDWESFEIDSRVASKIHEDFSIQSWKTEIGQETIIGMMIGDSFSHLLKRHVEAQIDYRSYVNSLYVKSVNGDELVLIPRFEPLNDEERALFPELEKQVEDAYRLACPDAEQVWIDCSVLSGFLGVIHCYTLAVPDYDSLGEN